MATRIELEAGRSTNRTCHKATAGTLRQKINSKSKAAGCGAQRLAAPIAQRVYHRFVQGPNVQQVSRGTIMQGRLLRVEGNAEGTTWYHMDSMVQKEIYSVEDSKLVAADSKLFYIPKRLSKRHRTFGATLAYRVCGALCLVKYRLCPSADFGNWVDFKRHCDTRGVHPLSISFYDHCGDFFARQDSL
ncbi:hypothetical protein BJV74DRAFT_847773 [Russula compacta]|nr:hypothetical protein BJV74DRAFT_847773 [Russula compacta]